MGKRVFIILGIVFVLAVIVSILGIYFFGFGSSIEAKYQPVETNSQNLPSYLEQSQMINDLPKTAVWQFNFGGYSYFYKSGEIKEGKVENAEITVSLPENYISVLGQKGICETLREANSKGDLAFESSLSGTDFLFRYSKLAKYKSCLS